MKKRALIWQLSTKAFGGGTRHLLLAGMCIGLSVAMIAGIAALADASLKSVRGQSRTLMGADIELSQPLQPFTQEVKDWAHTHGTTSEVIQTRTMLSTDERYVLAEIKAVDEAYPLYGEVKLEDAQMAALFAPGCNTFAEPSLISVLGIKKGDTFSLGSLTCTLAGTLAREPDRTPGSIGLGPRLMLSKANLEASGLAGVGSIAQYALRVKLNGMKEQEFMDATAKRFTDNSFRMRNHERAAPSLQRILERLALFLQLIALSALLLGGLGVVGAVRFHLEKSWRNIAILKSLGAPHALVVTAGMLHMALKLLPFVAAGLLAGACVPALAGSLLKDWLAVELDPTPNMAAMWPAFAVAFLGTALFSWWPLCETRSISPRLLLFARATPPHRPLKMFEYGIIGLMGGALLAVFIIKSGSFNLALGFVAGIGAAVLVFFALAKGVIKLVSAGKLRARTKLVVRMVHVQLVRAASHTVFMVMALSLSLTLLVAVKVTESSFKTQMLGDLPSGAPAFFFLDVPQGRLEAFKAAVATWPGVSDLQAMPMVRGRIAKLAGSAVNEAKVDESARWAVRGDRALTSSATLPEGNVLEEGNWWPADYTGEPLASLEAELARGLHVRVGDSISLTVLGKQINAKVANTRELQWGSLRMNFAIILSPHALDGLPINYLATLAAPKETEGEIMKAAHAAFPSIAAVQVRQVLQSLEGIARQVSAVVTGATLAALLAAGMVVAGVVLMGMQRRAHNAAVLKVLGGTRALMVKATLIEFALVGFFSLLCAVPAGLALSHAVLDLLFSTRMQLSLMDILLPLSTCSLLVFACALLACLLLFATPTRQLLESE